MSDTTSLATYGILSEPETFTIERLLPGPIERVWAYLTQSELRRKWLAAGEMTLRVGEPFEFVWRNAELTDPPGEPPAGASEEHRLTSEIVELDPPHRLGITWGTTGGVTFALEPQGDEVLLTVTHRRVTERTVLLNVSAGWHAHLDTLVAVMRDAKPAPFWDAWSRLRMDYERRIAA